MADIVLLSDLSPEELREAALFARACLMIETAARAGVLSEGLDIDPDRCEEILAFAADQGIEPTDADVELAVIDVIRQAACV